MVEKPDSVGLSSEVENFDIGFEGPKIFKKIIVESDPPRTVFGA